MSLSSSQAGVIHGWTEGFVTNGIIPPFETEGGLLVDTRGTMLTSGGRLDISGGVAGTNGG